MNEYHEWFISSLKNKYLHFLRSDPNSFTIGLQLFLTLISKPWVRCSARYIWVSRLLISHTGEPVWVYHCHFILMYLAFLGRKRVSREEKKDKHLAFPIVCSQGRVRKNIWTQILFGKWHQKLNIWHIMLNDLLLYFLYNSSLVF